jgi:hypothetical protein
VKGLNGVEKEVRVLSDKPMLPGFKRQADLALTMNNLRYTVKTISALGHIWGDFPVL